MPIRQRRKTMKHKKRTVVLLVALMVICTVAMSLTACNKGYQINDPEKRPFAMAISTPDGVFNPFFYTSGNDAEVIGLTQISMINTDVNGKPVVGDNEPTVVKAYTQEPGNDENGKDITTYRFLIKNGIKWSNGSDLTIHDVLFNLYVYLDPVYTGSATIYSTDIVGLQAYRRQDPSLLESGSGSGSVDTTFSSKADTRIDNLIDLVKDYYYSVVNPSERPTSLAPEYYTEEGLDKGLLDIAFVAKSFYEELLRDWKGTNREDYKDWGFTEKWQVFMFNDDGDTNFLDREKHDDDGNAILSSAFFKDEKGNYKLNEKYSNEFFNREGGLGAFLAKKNFAEKNADGKYEIIPQIGAENQKKLDDAIGEFCVEYAFQGKFYGTFPMELLKRSESRVAWENDEEKAKLEETLYHTNPDNFEEVVRYWGTAGVVLDRFTAEAKTAYFKENGRLVQSITGITTEKVIEFNGKALGASYDVLQIVIYDVDPKAILNFGFVVAPMYYYSSNGWKSDPNAASKNYIQAALDNPLGDADNGEYGLEFGDINFMNEVVNDPNHIAKPIGGGSYMASTSEAFFNNNIVNYERNPYFYTVFGNDESKNAKIKYVRYKVVESDQIVNSLTGGDLDYGEPSAKQDNYEILKAKKLITDKIITNGYGYVGINPRFIPDVNVRRAIIKALNAARILDDYYKGNFASQLKRPMSKALRDYYPFDNDVDYVSKIEEKGGIGIPGTSYAYDGTDTHDEILALLTDYSKGSDGILQRNTSLKGFGRYKLSYKFTIAGSSNDHPAYKLFLDAAKILNDVGFDIKVVTSQTALSDLSSGKLAVWAAAWSSSVDPDMYQVYHMESQASSVKNWGYPQILGGTNPDAWGDELEVIQKLSAAIDNGRSYLFAEDRAPHYAEALDWVMELACEFPIYQRTDLIAYQSGLLDPSTLPTSTSPFSGVLARIWEVNYYTA